MKPRNPVAKNLYKFNKPSIMLARQMESVRNDWNDGFGRVEWAIGEFVVESPEDQEIEDCIQEILQSEESDGRVFRDCEYNYSATLCIKWQNK